MRDHRVILRFGRHLLPCWKQEVLVLCLLIAGTLTTLARPYLMKVIIDEIFPFKELRSAAPGAEAPAGAGLRYALQRELVD